MSRRFKRASPGEHKGAVTNLAIGGALNVTGFRSAYGLKKAAHEAGVKVQVRQRRPALSRQRYIVTRVG